MKRTFLIFLLGCLLVSNVHAQRTYSEISEEIGMENLFSDMFGSLSSFYGSGESFDKDGSMRKFARQDTLVYPARDLVENMFGLFSIKGHINESEYLYDRLRDLGLNPSWDLFKIGSADIDVYLAEDPKTCEFNAVKRKFKLSGCDVLPRGTNMGYDPSKYDGGRVSYNFYFRDREECALFAKVLFSELGKAGYTRNDKGEILIKGGRISTNVFDYSDWLSLIIWLD